MKSNKKQKNIWSQCSVEDLVNDEILYKPLDGNHGGIHPKSSEFVSTGIPFVMASDIRDLKVDLINSNFITKNQADKLQKGFSLEGDVLLTHKGSVGLTAIVPEITTDYIMLTPQVTYYRVRDFEKLNNYYVFLYFQSNKFQSYIKSVSGGGTRAYIGITAQLSLPFMLPPLSEQNRIVAVLETWDTGIEKLKNKIDIKKQIKKGLMQELLTGKKRLPGFDGEWKSTELSSVVSISTGKKDVNEGNPDGQYPFFTCAREHTYSDSYSYDMEGILIAGNADVGHCKYYNGKFEAYQRTYILFNFNEEIDPIYLFLYMSFFFKNHVESLKQIGAMSYIKLPMLKKFEVKQPEFKEQKAIAQVLTTTDDEIAALEQKLTTWQDQKKYLLNNLVTGQIRTPEDMVINQT